MKRKLKIQRWWAGATEPRAIKEIKRIIYGTLQTENKTERSGLWGGRGRERVL